MDTAVSTALAVPAVAWRVSDDPVGYPEALAAMQDQAGKIRAGLAEETVWLLQHLPLYTAGTSAQPCDLTNPQAFPTYAAGRGGQWTYHGPGQRTAYVMLDLTRPPGGVPPRGPHAYVAALEAWLIGTLASFGITGERRADRVGVWVADGRGGEAKIAAIGVRVTRGVSWHGVSLNVCPELDHFTGIVPCGIREHGVTSLRAQGVTAGLAEVRARMREVWREVFE